jgi:hypothetical protein
MDAEGIQGTRDSHPCETCQESEGLEVEGRKNCSLVFPTSGCNPNFWLHKFGATFATWSLWKDDKEAKELPVRRALLDQTIWGFGIGGEDTKVDFARLSPCVQIMVR